jgi:uncharacterized membrane protein
VPRLLGLVYVLAGLNHFRSPRTYEAIMPPELPAHTELVLASGVAEIAGGLAVLHPRTRRLGGLWLVATLLAVFPANVHMAVRAERYPGVPAWLLWARLPLQAVLVWWAWAATRERPGRTLGA